MWKYIAKMHPIAQFMLMLCVFTLLVIVLIILFDKQAGDNLTSFLSSLPVLSLLKALSNGVK